MAHSSSEFGYCQEGAAAIWKPCRAGAPPAKYELGKGCACPTDPTVARNSCSPLITSALRVATCHNDTCIHPGNLIQRNVIKSVWRKHLIICLVLGLLAIPIYFLDRSLLAPGGGNWIALDFRGGLFWSFIIFVGVEVALSSIAILLLPTAGALRIHLASMVLAMILFITGVAVYGKLRRVGMSNEYQTMMASRRPLLNVIELKEWWYVPDENRPTEIRVNVVTHQPGRFAGNVIGE